MKQSFQPAPNGQSPSTPPLSADASQELQTQAAAGGPEAQNNLGILYASGESFPLDFQAAAVCYRKAADQGYALAQTNLARMFALGQGQPADEGEARRWFRRAANQGDAGAQFELGIKLHRLSLDAADGAAFEAKVEAFMWLQLAADQGFFKAESACSQLNLRMSNQEIGEAKRRVASFVAKPERPDRNSVMP
jgi:TPR repeat protein